MNIQETEGIFTFPEAVEENGGVMVPDNPENPLWSIRSLHGETGMEEAGKRRGRGGEQRGELEQLGQHSQFGH